MMKTKQWVISDWKAFQFILLIGLSLALFFPLLAVKEVVEVACPIAHNSGQPCPSCGLTQAWFHLYNGEISAAYLANPFAYQLLMLLLIQIIWRGFILVKMKRGKTVVVWDSIVSAATLVIFGGPYLHTLYKWVYG